MLHAGLEQLSPWVARFAHLVSSGEVLDLACGGGRHARLFASLGHSVLAVDRDADALARAAGPGIVTQQLDLEDESTVWPFAPNRFAGIIVTNYLHRPLFPHLFQSLAPGGILLYETFAEGNERFGKPSNPLFLLKASELLEIVVQASVARTLRVVAFEDGYVDVPKPAMIQRICVLKADPASAPEGRRLG